jgi:transmembrane sensor
MSTANTSHLEEAVAWRARLSEMDAESYTAFESWLEEDPGHVEAWKGVQESWKVFSEHATAPEIIKLRRAALAHAHEASRSRWVGSRQSSWPGKRVSRSHTLEAGQSQSVHSQRFVSLGRLTVAAGVLAVAIGGWWLWQVNQPEVYKTRAGERHVVTLSDGSQVALDSQSEVKIRYTERARELTLTSGQARFDVSHDVERPFSVIADGHKVIATGTAFNIDLSGSNVLVTLIEGHAVVLPQAARSGGSAEPARVDLSAGEQLVLSQTALPSKAHVNVERAIAWENGEVRFENDLLSTVVARLNRYSDHKIVIGDKMTSQLRISGVFHTADVDGFVSTIVSNLPVRAEKTADGTTRLTSSP